MRCCLCLETCTAATLAAPTGQGHIPISISYGRSGPNLAAYQRGTSKGIDAAAEGALLPPGRVARSEFTSNKLAPKLAQQLKVRQMLLWSGAGRIGIARCRSRSLLPEKPFGAGRHTSTGLSPSPPFVRQDVLAVCGGTLPAWADCLVFGSRFLFPFALRRAWFRATALGMPRALSHLQARLVFCRSCRSSLQTLEPAGACFIPTSPAVQVGDRELQHVARLLPIGVTKSKTEPPSADLGQCFARRRWRRQRAAARRTRSVTSVWPESAASPAKRSRAYLVPRLSTCVLDHLRSF